ncbi:uncharacterized protein [Euphorbia lathyris]|uniref:uncharacterized protein n=1 Tax=Euphorbia lathyris TaxID=212925 RepID=UPI0033137C6F
MQPPLETQVSSVMKKSVELEVPTIEIGSTDISNEPNTQSNAAPNPTVTALNPQTKMRVVVPNAQTATNVAVLEDGQPAVYVFCSIKKGYLTFEAPFGEVSKTYFWNKSSMRYPELAKMACDLLSIPVSMVASESAFSIGGKTITSTRSSLKSSTVQAIICLRDWIKATDEQSISKDNFESSRDDGSDVDEGEDCELDLF